jgi:peptidoglycan/xylan/chitin deacetylase (PgdA/CDA1 family)
VFIKIVLGWFVFLSVQTTAVAAVILQYHNVSDTAPASTSTRVELFEQHLAYLAEHDFTVMPLPELISQLQGGQALPDKTVAITFDDGYRSVYDTAFARLKQYGFAFTVFVNSAPIEQGLSEFVTWDELAQMAQAGGSIANHTKTHPFMVRQQAGETNKQWRERIEREVTGAEQAIKKATGESLKLLAYPYGEFDYKLKKLLQTLGYVGLGQHSGAVDARSDFLALPRFPMGGDYAKLESFITKVQTRPLPIKARTLYRHKNLLNEPVVPAGSRPQVRLTLAHKKLAAGLTCYYRGQELPLERDGAHITITPKQGLAPGRSRFNCTARAEDGRYYWYSQPWFVTDEEGQWQHQS